MKIKIIIHNSIQLLKETVNSFMEDNVMKLSASLSYFTIFSLPPLLVIIIGLGGVFYGQEAVKGEIFGQLYGLVGSDAALQIQETIKKVELTKSGTFATIVGIVLLLIGASGVFVEIQDSLNFIWGIRAKPKRGMIKFMKNRIVSFSMIASIGFLLLVGLIVNSILDIFSRRMAVSFPNNNFIIFYWLNIFFVFLIIALLFTVIFKALPDGKIALRDCMVGASFTSVLFMFGKFAIGAYLGESTTVGVYGTAGSVIIILIWVYYSAVILYFGAEFTKVYAFKHGMKIIPNAYSVRIEKEIVEVETR